MQVPILHPNIIGKATLISKFPDTANATKIPVVADELCNIAVIKIPISTPNIEFFPTNKINLLNIANSDTGFKEEDINPIPINNTPKPNAI